MRRPQPSPGTLAKIDRILNAVGRERLPAEVQTTRLVKLLDGHAAYTLRVRLPEIAREKKRWTGNADAIKKIRVHASHLQAAIQAIGDLPSGPRLRSVLPESEIDGEGFDGLAALELMLGRLDRAAADEANRAPPLPVAKDQSSKEHVVAGAVREAFNEVMGLPIDADASRYLAKPTDSDAAIGRNSTDEPEGPFIDFAKATMDELGRPMSASSISGALSKQKNIDAGKPARRAKDAKPQTGKIKPTYKVG